MTSSLSGKPREFPFTPLRMGGHHVKNIWDFECYKCGAHETVESRVSLPDQVVRKKIQQKGWVLGRKRDSDTCADCMGIGVKNLLAEKFKVTEDGKPVVPAHEIIEEKSMNMMENIKDEQKSGQKDRIAIVSAEKIMEVILPVMQALVKELGDIRAASELNSECASSIASSLKEISGKLEVVRSSGEPVVEKLPAPEPIGSPAKSFGINVSPQRTTGQLGITFPTPLFKKWFNDVLQVMATTETHDGGLRGVIRFRSIRRPEFKTKKTKVFQTLARSRTVYLRIVVASRNSDLEAWYDEVLRRKFTIVEVDGGIDLHFG